MKKKILAIVLAVALVFSLSACNLLSGSQMSIRYEDTEDGLKVKIFEGTSKESEYTIPDSNDGKDIVELGDFSFANGKHLVTLKIGKNVSRISNRAIVNNGLLKQIIVDSENEHYTSVDGVLFTKDKKTLVAFPNAAGTEYVKEVDAAGNNIIGRSYVVPENTEVISEMAFYRCFGISKITLPSTLKRIDEMGFFKCSGLSTISFPDGLESIKRDAFGFVDKLQDVYIPSSVNEIGDYAFCGCDNVVAFRMERPSLEGMTLSKNWMPYTATKLNLLFSQTRGNI